MKRVNVVSVEPGRVPSERIYHLECGHRCRRRQVLGSGPMRWIYCNECNHRHYVTMRYGLPVYRLVNVRLAGNEHGQLNPDVLYAELVDAKGVLLVSATLDYVLARVRGLVLDGECEVDGVEVLKRRGRGGVMETEVRLARYR